MRTIYLFVLLSFILTACMQKKPMEQLDFSHYPSQEISNGSVEMKLYLPDREKGLYRATRFDWSGVIGSVKYRGHEYFGYWKDNHDPEYHEDLTGPVEGFIKPGLGYAEAKPGDGFIRLGVGILKKEDEPEYNWRKTYEILDHGIWTVKHGEDWIEFTHLLNSDFGYGYVYTKTIRLKEDGFVILHSLKNTGEKSIDTDQFNHNFFRIDGEKSGTAFQLSFPFALSAESDLKDYLEIQDHTLSFIRDLEVEESVFTELEGFGKDVKDHEISVLNRESGAGVSFRVDKPLHRMVFWACHTTLSPENFIWISVNPGEEDTWTSTYRLFILEASD